jgi:transcriptional regulator with XRE-family HTH domain
LLQAGEFPYVCNVKANEKLRVLRVIKGYSQEVVANELGLDSGSYSRIERGVTELKYDIVSKVLEVLNVSWDEFLKFENDDQKIFNNQQGDNNSFQTVVEGSLVPYLKGEIDSLRRETQGLRQQIIDLTERLIDKH